MLSAESLAHFLWLWLTHRFQSLESAFPVHCVRLAPPGLLFDPVDAACRGRVCFPCRSCWRECGRCWATGQSLLPWACSRGYYLGPAYSLMVLLEVGGRHFPGPLVLLGRRMGSRCWPCGAGSVSQDLLSSASCANMLLIPRVPVPLREGNITRGRLLSLVLGVFLHHQMWSGDCGDRSPSAAEWRAGRPEACLCSWVESGAHSCRCCRYRQGSPARDGVKTGCPPRALLPLSWPFSQRELAFAWTLKNLYLLVVWVVGLLQYPSRIYGKQRETPGTLPPCSSSSPKVPSQPASSFHLSESFYGCL